MHCCKKQQLLQWLEIHSSDATIKAIRAGDPRKATDVATGSTY